MEKKQNVPELRFQGFSGKWSKRTLENMCDIFTDGDWIEANDQSDTGIRLIQTGNIGIAEYIDKPEHKKWISKETFDRLHCTAVLSGDILISRLPDPAGRACIIPELGMEMITAVDCTIVRVAEEYSKEYLVQYLSTHKYFAEVKNCLAGGTRQRISRGNLSVFSIPVPTDKTEQDRIGKFFERLDDSINVKKRKIQKLQQFRQAMLAKLFPREGAAEPELRFRGFSGKWTKKKLGEICQSFEYGLNAAAIPYDGQHKYLRITDIDDESRAFSKENLTSPANRMPEIEQYLLHEGDIVFARTGASVGKTYLYTSGDGEVYYAGFLIRGHIKAEYDANFIFQNTLTKQYQHFVSVTSQRSGQPGINAQEYSSFSIFLPTLEEQRKIGDFFRNLDTYISLQQKKLERMQQLKAALLEKMFV